MAIETSTERYTRQHNKEGRTNTILGDKTIRESVKQTMRPREHDRMKQSVSGQKDNAQHAER